MATFLGLSALAAAPLNGFLFHEPTSAGRLFVAGTIALATYAPSEALLVLVSLVPLAGPLGHLLGVRINLVEPLIQAFLAGWLLRTAFVRSPSERGVRSLVWTSSLLVGVILSSCAVELATLQVGVAHTGEYIRRLLATLAWTYYIDVGPFRVLTQAMQTVAGIGLFAATVQLVEHTKGLGRRVAICAILAGAGLSALQLNRLAEVVLRNGPSWQELAQQFQTIRISVAFPDFNAAGSYLALVLLVAASACGFSRAGLAACTATLTTGAGVWLTGSRAALVASLLTLPGLALWRLRERRRLCLLVVVLIVATGVGLFPALVARLDPPLLSGRSIEGSTYFRKVQTQFALRMIAAHPLTGVGHGAFQAKARHYADNATLPLATENAHNNCLQILAELGLLGFIPLVWLLAEVARRTWRGPRTPGDNWITAGVALGLVTFGLTCLVGHPLLILPVAASFWMMLGALAGLAGGPSETLPGSGNGWIPRIAAAAGVLLLLTLPWRATAALADADLSEAAIGLGQPERNDTGVFRRVTGPAQFFVPTTATFMRLPVRLEEDRVGGAVVSLSLDHRPANRVHVEGTGWTDIPMVLPRDWTGRRYRSVQLTVSSTGTDPAGPARVCLGQPLLTPSR